ncbi:MULTISPECIES: glycosyltransferase [Microbacterium]|uniref:glycosyltransferase n=1 Tax=Microbacterium TaxID=33882 RepID=UPI000D650F65|nr:glycosyltransferase [Microbacterium sp. KCTC 39802]
MSAPLPLAHLAALTDDRGIFEHASRASPRREHGYCLDDAARALIVTVREDGSTIAGRLTETYLTFVDHAVVPDGRARNRMDIDGRWRDAPARGDWWGRALHGLAVAATMSGDEHVRRRAHAVFERAARASGPGLSLRTAAFAALGAAAVLEADPRSAAARRVLDDARPVLTAPAHPGWCWPEDRLHYANGSLPDALLAAGTARGERDLIRRGLELLDFLLARETRDGHLSPTPVGGRGPFDAAPAFDQQPLEAAAIADAALRARTVTGQERWQREVRRAWAWFEGDNDVGVALFDPVTGAGYDGLTPTGRNDNRGAESTISALATLQRARVLEGASVV